MAEQRNFLLGKGERLTEPVLPSGRKLERIPPYTYEEARVRLRPMIESALSELTRLPENARPLGQVVGNVTLNPEYIAKSYYPEHVLKTYGLKAVGSKPTVVTPDQRSPDRTGRARPPVEKPTTQLFVAGNIGSFRRLLADIEASSVADAVQQDLPALEQFNAPDPASKIKGSLPQAPEVALEVVLHATEFRSDTYIITAFQDFLNARGLEADLQHRFHAGGLCFLRMVAPSAVVPEIALFSFLRAVREMPRLRDLVPLRGAPGFGAATLPTAAAIDPNVRVAIFDGGLPENSPLTPWVTCFDPPGIGPPVPDALDHGYAVTGAALFGSLSSGTAPRPFANVHHIRVWDENSGSDPLELFDVLERIKNTLDSSPKYDFINLSLGPCLPIEDDDVHAWTAVLDEYLADGACVATIAVGNDGERDADAGLNRIQVPADTVNGLSIGASDGQGPTWKRAPYSSVGPGRSPGLVKPDLVAFGGCAAAPYIVLGGAGQSNRVAQCGTSFAAPHTLRIGTGVKANFGGALDALAVRTLLIHTAEASEEPQHEIGWGRVSENIDDIIVCPDGSFRVVYQGELTASKYLRAEIPLPDEALRGMVSIKATCCFATEIDSAHPGSYTRSGLEIFFRPHASIVEENATHAKTSTFLSQSRLYQTEDLLRTDAHKWETSLHGAVRKRASSLERPVFDIHYLSRDEGHVDHQTAKIKYALVITVEAPRHKDLYDMIVRKYRNVLEPMVPIQVPIQV
ncbi:MAG: S8 family serine peptidase [Phenylobacterium sp.]|uniref:S8 family peptidase n=1 Tax=Phenylobacterium sp. TaxID=1871053 RepID=UPI0025D274F4|nr:S8 family peptidase [Phenylobacterium sp.]MBI1199672.1 S8 family serine peptidase [Phenylobacterium sp.]